MASEGYPLGKLESPLHCTPPAYPAQVARKLAPNSIELVPRRTTFYCHGAHKSFSAAAVDCAVQGGTGMKLSWVLFVMFMAGCFPNHAKRGDRAAATGDWKTAVRMYKKALADKPDSVPLREKFENAKKQ